MKPSAQYIAGFTDGEGYISRGDFRIELLNTNVHVLRKIHKAIRVGRVKPRSKTGQGHHLGRKKQYKLQILGRLNVHKFLSKVLPFIIVKRKRAVVLSKAANKSEIRRMNHGR